MRSKVKRLKKWLNKALLCGALACALALPTGFIGSAEEEALPAPEPTAQVSAAPTQEPAAEPTSEPTSEPTLEPTSEPSTESTAEPTAEPTSEPSAEPTAEPTSEPTLEPTLEPTPEASAEPTMEPTGEPTPEPTPAPGTAALPEKIDGLVRISAENGMQQSDGSWSIVLTSPEAPLVFTWTSEAEAQLYRIYVQVDAQSMKPVAETSNMRVELPAADYLMGQHTLYVGAVLADESVTWGSAVFAVASQQGGFPGGMGGFPGGMMSGGMPGMEAEQGFRITPGVALTDSHSSGTMDDRDYRAAELPEGGEALAVLELANTRSEITLDGGSSSFFAELSSQEARLMLTPAEGGECWELSLLALKTLADSGVEQVEFYLDGAVQRMDTDLRLAGAVYGGLRAQGLVDKDLQLCITAEGVTVRVAECEYWISGDELVSPGE